MAAITFNDYIIEKSIYSTNPSFEQPHEEYGLVIEEDVSAEVGIKNDKGYVKIKLLLNKNDDVKYINNTPFFLEVVIRGIFSHEYETEEKAHLKSLLGSNALAILYPYLRSYVSFLTANTNQFPTYILPVVNFAKLISDEEKIHFIGFDD
ncbi:protein-export chaperone SecB [Enterococcus gallinarum]|uniref:Preprotein translocase subunit SecB n=1 Tax=Siphoviridae sp. ct1is2 TaxID=2826273 RepID=A0A8S5NM72_9CAUD|nr:MAG TPA: Preprotein translocase subunit SecB [Siphoviridae sp. ct1is2]